MTEIEQLHRLLTKHLPEYALVQREALLDAERIHLLHLEALARARHGIADWEPVPGHLVATPLRDQMLSGIEDDA